MHRSSVGLLLVIVLLAGFTAGIAFGRPIASNSTAGQPADIETARAFDRALNEALSGSDTDGLSALLASSFMEHEVGSGETQSAEAFLERLGMIARSSPGVRLEADSIETLGTNLIVAV